MAGTLKILAVADAPDRALSDHFNPERWRGIDVIMSCGDLEPEYLDYLVSRLNVPCFYVRGNHDAVYAERPPGGCEDLNGRIVRFRGLRLAGLEGARWYGGQGVECTDRAMAWRARRLGLKALFSGALDILLTHAPPTFRPEDRPEGAGSEPEPDRVHRGFDSIRDLVLGQRPRLHLHGHTHLGYGRGEREKRLGSTRVIDCYGAYVLDLPD